MEQEQQEIGTLKIELKEDSKGNPYIGGIKVYGSDEDWAYHVDQVIRIRNELRRRLEDR